MKITLTVVACLFFQILTCLGQEIIHLRNPSFEDMPRNSVPPKGWSDCRSFYGETPPDTQPLGLNGFNVTKAAYDGDTYLGMVVRDNGTWESVGQQLSSPLKAGVCYKFSLFLCRSEICESHSRLTSLQANYVIPVKLKIFGSQAESCVETELLGETDMVTNTQWIRYNFEFSPKSDLRFITLTAFYGESILNAYNGNILIDNASPLIPCDLLEDNYAYFNNDTFPYMGAEKPAIRFPESFSPDGDGKEDYFVGYSDSGVGVKIEILSIYDWWGNLVFEGKDIPANDEKSGWDGKIDGKDKKGKKFTYEAFVINEFGERKKYSGVVKIAR
ncbi:MAG TPA: gliding motility-associated C-terminal domain-containing protein [Saprospiraceae bacterium]|nr:gliding motility-associated C-terminal domain-containing protein [Saprospiraceae bacterium]